MAAEEGVHAPQEVSAAFVEQYYHIMANMTHDAHKLYVDASVVSRPCPDGTMLSFTSLEAIKSHYLTCDYKGTTYDVLSVDSQSSLQDGIFIMVIGFLTGKDNLKRKFSQSFYLASQNTSYVVVNDMYRFVDEESSPPAVESVPEVAVAKAVDEIRKIEPVLEKSVNVSEVKKVVGGATPPLDNGNNKRSDVKAVAAQKPKEPVAETAAPPLDGAKKSYAAMVQAMLRNAAPFQVNAASVQKPKPMAHPKPRASPAPKSPVAVKHDKKSDQKFFDEPGTSIFVANLPMDAMPPQLYELFKGFGPIKEDGVQIRSSRASGRCFGFVAFESVASVQSVLKAAKSNAFKLGEQKLRVKEKQVEYYGSKPSGGRSKTENESLDESKSQNGSVDENKTQTSSVDGSKNGSAGDEDGEFTLIRSRRNRKREGNVNGGDKKNSERGGAPKVKA